MATIFPSLSMNFPWARKMKYYQEGYRDNPKEFEMKIEGEKDINKESPPGD
jgi:hypothetical protein